MSIHKDRGEEKERGVKKKKKRRRTKERHNNPTMRELSKSMQNHQDKETHRALMKRKKRTDGGIKQIKSGKIYRYVHV